MSVALVLGVARAVNILLENGYISDTILNYFSGVVTGMSPMPFILVMLVAYIILGFSSTALRAWPCSRFSSWLRWVTRSASRKRPSSRHTTTARASSATSPRLA
nr:hypothetical protein [Olsenella uli]